MVYRVFATYSDVTLSPGQSEPDYSLLTPYVFDTKELALANAFAFLDSQAAIAWQIDGPDGFLMGRRKIERAYFAKFGRWPKP